MSCSPDVAKVAKLQTALHLMWQLRRNTYHLQLLGAPR